MSESSKELQLSTALCDDLVTCLEDGKALDIARIDVSGLTTVTDYMVIATGTSSRHVKALCVNTIDEMRERGVRARGVEGEDAGEWVLMDFGDVVVHVMQKSVRDHYDLEGLWQSGFTGLLPHRGDVDADADPAE